MTDLDDRIRAAGGTVPVETLPPLVKAVADAINGCGVMMPSSGIARAALAAIEAAGYRVVPVEPTEAIQNALWDVRHKDGDYEDGEEWAAMVAAAPKIANL